VNKVDPFSMGYLLVLTQAQAPNIVEGAFSEVRIKYHSRSDGMFPRMRQIPILLLLLLCVVALAAIFLVTGCTDSGSQAGQGTASLEDISEGVLVKLELYGLPEPKEFYLARPTPCVRIMAYAPPCGLLLGTRYWSSE